MKKVLTVLSLIEVLGLTMSSANAAPGGPGGPGGPRGGHHVVHAGPGMHHRPHHGGHRMAPPPPRHHHYHGGIGIVGGVLARRSYWGYPYYDYRLGLYDDFYYRPYRPYNAGFYIRF